MLALYWYAHNTAADADKCFLKETKESITHEDVKSTHLMFVVHVHFNLLESELVKEWSSNGWNLCRRRIYRWNTSYIVLSLLQVPWSSNSPLSLEPAQSWTCWQSQWGPSLPPTEQISFQCSFSDHTQRACKHKDDAWPSLQERT